MNPVKRLLTALIFYPILVLWFIPKELIRNYRKVGRMWADVKHTRIERIKEANRYFRQELKIAMSARSRKPIDYGYLDIQLADVKRLAGKDEKLVIEKELGITANVTEEPRGS